MAREEVRERRGCAMRVLHLQPVRGVREDEPFGVRQPRQQQPVRLTKPRPQGIALATEHSEDGLGDAPHLGLAEAPVPQPGALLLEPGPRIGHGLGEGSRQCPVEPGTIAGPEARQEELVNDDRRSLLPVPLPPQRQRIPVALGRGAAKEGRPALSRIARESSADDGIERIQVGCGQRARGVRRCHR